MVAVRQSTARAGVILLFGAISMGALPSCARDAEPVAKTEPARAELRSERATAAQNAKKTAVTKPRKQIRDAELHLEVLAYAKVRSAIDRMLAAAGGYLANAKIDHDKGTVSSAELSLRIPAGRLDSFLAQCTALGTVLHESVQTRDVSEQYYDLKARLDNARRLEDRLLELVDARAQNVKDLLEVERELGRVREQVEQHEGKLRLLESQVAMSKLVLRLTTRQRFSAGREPAFTSVVADTFNDSLQGVVLAFKALLLVLVALAPWSPLIALGPLLLYRRIRRLRDQSKAQQATVPVSTPWGQPPGYMPQATQQPAPDRSPPDEGALWPSQHLKDSPDGSHEKAASVAPHSTETPSSSRGSPERDG